MKALRSLRGRVAVLATIAVGVVLAAVGSLVVTTFADREHQQFDRELQQQPPGGFVRELQRGAEEPGPGGMPPTNAFGPGALRPEGEYLRLINGGGVELAVGVPDGLALPEGPGVRTVHVDDKSFRAITRPTPDGALIEVGRDLSPLEDRIASLRNRVILIALAGVALAGAFAWWLAGITLRPLRALSGAVARVSTTRDLSTRLPQEQGVGEVDELSASVNEMLTRLERSEAETEKALEATRRFAADAGHELRTPMTALRANLGALTRNPRMDAAERQAALDEAEQEAERTIRLLEALQTLARGDVGAALPRERLDAADVLDVAVEAARRRHPDMTFRVRAPEHGAELAGWPDGIRTLIDNLLENAAKHGRRGGTVAVAIDNGDRGMQLTVDDDGPGVPAAERSRIFERFVRSGTPGADGSGLGLALVLQQARLHGGSAWVEDSPLGGARFVVQLAKQ
jgi:two-component system, OmpR family, sensor histidine kinase PrrB